MSEVSVDRIKKYDLDGKEVFAGDDYYENDPLYRQQPIELALERAEQAGIAIVRDEIDKIIAQMRGVGESDESSFPDVVGNLVGASHIETLRKRLFG